jgi:hypothetical protein
MSVAIAAAIVFAGASARAVDPPSVTAAAPPPPRAFRLGIDVGYFGDFLTHPGAVVRGDFVLGRGVHRLVVAAELGSYGHPGDYIGLFLGASVGYRVASRVGIFGEAAAGVGWLETFVEGDLYQRAPDGSVVAGRDPGHAAFMPSLSLAAGWDFQRRNLPLAIYLRPRVFWQYPENTQWLIHGGVEIGLTWWIGR